jgi:tetratricopeptide (TPR) repeat protein
MAFHQALQQELIKGENTAINQNFKAAINAEGQLQPRWLELYAGFLSRNAPKEDVRALLKNIVEQSDGDSQAHFARELLNKIEAKNKLSPEVSDAKSGLAQAFFELAWLFARQNLLKDASFFVQMSLALDPKSDATLMLLGDIKQAVKDWDAAENAYRQVTSGSLYGAEAAIGKAETLNGAKRKDEAVASLKKTIDLFPHLSDAPALLGDMLRSDNRFGEAVDAYSAALSSKKNPHNPRNWGLYYYRGTAYERNKQWPEAEKDFLTALKLKPDEPYVLNYLAYSWTERKENLDQAVKMLERAAELRPEDGFIIDSLGWVYFQTGRTDKAVPLLERAVELSPSDPTLNDHLGDVYWRVGRYSEARFQWQRALLNNPEPDQVAPLEEKIKNGLSIVKSGG